MLWVEMGQVPLNSHATMARFQPSSLLEVLIGRESGRLKRIAGIRRTANGKKPGETGGLRHLPFLGIQE
jgi:hypothetical protein